MQKCGARRKERVDGVNRLTRHGMARSRHDDLCTVVERVPMVKGRLDRKATSATSYAWLVWRKGSPAPTEVRWIPPCRKRWSAPATTRATIV